MNDCRECGANAWKFKTDGDMVEARCSECHNAVRFGKKQKITVPTCPDCGGKLTVRAVEFRKEFLKMKKYPLTEHVCTKCSKVTVKDEQIM